MVSHVSGDINTRTSTVHISTAAFFDIDFDIDFDIGIRSLTSEQPVLSDAMAAVNKAVWPGGSVTMARDIKRVTRARMTPYITCANCCLPATILLQHQQL